MFFVITYCCDYDVFKFLRVFTTWFCVSQSTYRILFQEIYRSKVLSSYKDMVYMLIILLCRIGTFVSFFHGMLVFAVLYFILFSYIYYYDVIPTTIVQIYSIFTSSLTGHHPKCHMFIPEYHI